MPPTIPINHYGGPRNQQNRTTRPILLFHANSWFPDTPSEGHAAPQKERFNYELFNCNNFNIRYWSWNYRGCWHQTCPPIVPR
ncbi:unnamed protein product [Zymoseptoria tritici ST99CH_3D7]|uniref:Uncharacterized protein n=1 Tax=Zymoseptoria tritici (strain ST99CH_3D7) TaxID=1276538 RepID=A0A1X7RZ16_ZYMT9|nr:unnamed protein product [Zymoseptoria tritici ST99CH_3D7]SMQ52685.1 unnamed protein product [Zymoseptoria tritici ST99CH_3D7]